MALRDFFFTLGQAHSHMLGLQLVNRDVVIHIPAESYGAARRRMFAICDDKWAFQYDIGFFEKDHHEHYTHVFSKTDSIMYAMSDFLAKRGELWDIKE